MNEVALDERYRILLDKKTRHVAGFKKRDRLVAIPFKGGVILVAPKGRKYKDSLTGFHFVEERHEATRYLFRRKG